MRKMRKKCLICIKYVYVYVSYFCIKRGDPQIRIQAKQERRTSEYYPLAKFGLTVIRQNSPPRDAPRLGGLTSW